MKVLFVSSGNSRQGISPVIFNQGESLKRAGIFVDYFTIVGKGLLGYLKSIPSLYRYNKEHDFHLVHAHYSFSAFVATLATCKPLIVSLMGSDVKSKGWIMKLIRGVNFFFWNACIVKSIDMKKSVGIRHVHIIPNGVNFKLHKPINRIIALQELDWDSNKKHLLFAADPLRIEKNFKLTEKAIKQLNRNDVVLHYLLNVAHEKTPLYYAASNVILLSSLWEGSSNVIKEAMACNCPVVTTNVGDVQWLFGNEPGHFIVSNEYEDIVEKIELALLFSERYGSTNGRKRIIELKLDAELIADRIIDLYKNVVT